MPSLVLGDAVGGCPDLDESCTAIAMSLSYVHRPGAGAGAVGTGVRHVCDESWRAVAESCLLDPDIHEAVAIDVPAELGVEQAHACVPVPVVDTDTAWRARSRHGTTRTQHGTTQSQA